MSENVVQLETANTKSGEKKKPRPSEKKWGVPVMSHGHAQVPSLLLRMQRRLNIDATQLAIVVHLIDFWRDQEPFPSKATLATRLNVSTKTVQRAIARLEEQGYIERVERYDQHGRTSNNYSLDGLVTKLKEIEPEVAQEREEARKRRAATEKPGLKKRRSNKS
jgi:predicted transcriptional regulator